jgi:hypothetical protein
MSEELPFAAKEPRLARKPYTAPRLVEYGPVEKLTEGGSGTKVDGANMTKK